MRTVSDGRKEVAVAGTREALSATPNTFFGGLIVTAELNNTGIIVVGGSTVVASEATRRGTPLAAGESTAFNPGWSGDQGLGDLSKIFIDTTINTDGVTFIYMQ